jgi:hypothetical protein
MLHNYLLEYSERNLSVEIGSVESGRKTFNIENSMIYVKSKYKDDVELTIPLHLSLSVTYFFKVDETIKSVIDSHHLTKGKKKTGLI